MFAKDIMKSNLLISTLLCITYLGYSQKCGEDVAMLSRNMQHIQVDGQAILGLWELIPSKCEIFDPILQYDSFLDAVNLDVRKDSIFCNFHINQSDSTKKSFKIIGTYHLSGNILSFYGKKNVIFDKIINERLLTSTKYDSIECCFVINCPEENLLCLSRIAFYPKFYENPQIEKFYFKRDDN